MTPETIRCPYCNATVAALDSGAAGGRLSCPRCGEIIPYRDSEAAWLAPVLQHNGPPSHPEPASPLPRTPLLSNCTIAALVIGIFGLMALVSLSLALETTAYRRAQDKGLIKPQLVSVPLAIKIARDLWIVGLVYILLGVWSLRARSAGEDRTIQRVRLGIVIALAALLLTADLLVKPGGLLRDPVRHRNTQLPPESEP